MTKTTASKNQYADSRDFMTSLLFRKWTIATKSAHRAPQAARTRRHRPALFLSDDSAAS